MIEHGYLAAPHESFYDFEPSRYFYYASDDYPEYPDEEDFDKDYPSKEGFEHEEYAEEEYFDWRGVI